jgi:GNAT superfamily N-acetyltransferase/nitroimidazol reductase NimA-like FMN-containing flavoprotein (pyridoxamine 5'-phosphate oxidase superfamily)
MRRREFELTADEAIGLLAELPVVHLASTLADGTPVLRTVHPVVVGDRVCFHSAPKGEKTGLVGRAAVLCAEETVATVPSTFFDPEKACPATTYYRSVQVHGTLEEIVEPDARARVLQALIKKLQPEGGHVPITAGDPRYRGPVNGLLVVGVRLDRVAGKAKLAQNRSPAQITDLLARLWQRGADGDTRAVELIRAANPDAPAPAFLAAPAGATLHAWLPPAAADDAARLLAGSYWNDVFEHADLVRAHHGASAWAGARDGDGRLIASARALADGGKLAWIYDVIVAPAWRGRGLGQAMMRVILDHPRVRGCKRVMLATRDAESLYARFGFVDRAASPPRAFASTEMVLVRG